MNSKKLKSLIFDNWPAKALSLACALVLFFFHRMSSVEERIFSVPLQIEGAGKMAPASPYTRMIRITLRAADSIDPVKESDIEAFIDLGNSTEKGARHFPVQVRKKGAAQDIDALQIDVDPKDILLELDERASKFVDITPRIQGTTASGYELTSHSLNPSRIRIDGPEGLVRRITEITTEDIDLDARNADFTAISRVVNPDPLLTLHGESIVEYRGEVRSLVIIRTVDNVLIAAEGLAAGLLFSAEPAVLSLRIEGPQNELEFWQPVTTVTPGAGADVGTETAAGVGAGADAETVREEAAGAAASAHVDIPSASPALTGTMETAALASGAFTDASYTRSVLYVDCSAITRPGVYDLEVKADLPEHFALLGTATHASALNAPLPVVRVIIHEALH